MGLRRCRPRTTDTCSRCHRLRDVHARWPLGPVCVTCYSMILDHPGRCRAAAASTAPLVGQGNAGAPLCGPCSGLAAHPLSTLRSGRDGATPAGRAPAARILADRLTQLIGANGTVPRQLRPLVDALIADQNPRSLILWVSRRSQCAVCWLTLPPMVKRSAMTTGRPPAEPSRALRPPDARPHRCPAGPRRGH